MEEFFESVGFISLSSSLEDLRQRLSTKSRTAKLWFTYLDYINITKRFIFAERTCNWLMHIEYTTEMLNLFASSGHINYAKSARLYIQQMHSLKETQPWLYKQFLDCNHAVRRSDQYWSGLWSDLVIEQTLMRSIKSRGDLTRGRGMDESVRHMWVLSLNHCAAIHGAMMQLSGLSLKSSEQHVELGSTRMSQDHKD